MRLCRPLLALVAACMLAAGAYAQAHNSVEPTAEAPNLEPKTPQDKLVPTISYERVLPGEYSTHFVISVDSSGNAAYRSRLLGPAGEERSPTGRQYILKFTVSQPTCQRIFQLAKAADYFGNGAPTSIDSFNPTFARGATSFNTLSYSYGPVYTWDLSSKSVRNSITYTDTASPAVRELASIFESMSRSLQQGRIDEAANVVK